MEKILSQLLTPKLTGDSVEEKRKELQLYFQNSWATYEKLFAHISDDEAFFIRAERLRHPLIFYYGHTATFFINKLILGKYIDKRIDPKIEAICAVGVDEMSWDDLNSEHYDWPSVSEVKAYRQQVFSLVEQLINCMELTLPIEQNSLAWIVLMGVEHERIHLETSSVIMRMLPLEFLNDTSSNPKSWPSCEQVGIAPDNTLLSVNGGQLLLGKTNDDDTYGWDNEYGLCEENVPTFKASKYLVSNQEYLVFVEEGGYQNSHYWSEEGQGWLTYTCASMPRFWFKKNNEYFQRNLLNEMPLPLDWPVEINHLEAHAFCQWKSEKLQLNIRMPTEAEWYCLRLQALAGANVSQHSNTNLAHFASSCPINSFSQGEFFDVTGNVWQWTESAIDGYPGFKVHPLYDDFSTPTFDGKHNLIKGGSWISTGNEIIASSRYAFRRHFSQHAGFRYVAVKSATPPTTKLNAYETDMVISQQLYADFLTSDPVNMTPVASERYCARLARIVVDYCKSFAVKQGRILDLGCGVGGSSFALSSCFDSVDGVDFSARTIQHGVALQAGNTVRFCRPVEGDIVSYHEISLAANKIVARPEKINFSQGDASNLKAVVSGYDVVIAQQTLESCYDPRLFLSSIAERLNSNGLLIVVSHYLFDETICDKEKWLGGKKINGENMTGFDGLKLCLEKDFILKDQQDISKVEKVSPRETRLQTLEVSVWQKQ